MQEFVRGVFYTAEISSAFRGSFTQSSEPHSEV